MQTCEPVCFIKLDLASTVPLAAGISAPAILQVLILFDFGS
jgi:hypothetical protein